MLPQIQPLVKVDAMKFAAEWKAKMRTNPENSLEVLSFLQFLTTYGLLSSFNEDEILKFLETVSQHEEALDLCSTLSFAKKIPGKVSENFFLSCQFCNKLQKFNKTKIISTPASLTYHFNIFFN